MIEVGNIRNNIVLLRKGGKVSQRKLAEFLHVSPQTVSGWENGAFYPDIPQLVNLANYFQVQIDGLFEDKKVKLEKEYVVTFESLGTTIIEWRKAKGLTQKGFADKLSVSPQAVSHWERGQGFPDLSVLSQICELLNVNLHRLLCGDTGANETDAGVNVTDTNANEGDADVSETDISVQEVDTNANEAAKGRTVELKHNRRIILILPFVLILAIVGVIVGVVLGVKNNGNAPKVPPADRVVYIGSYDDFAAHADSFADKSTKFVFTADIDASGHQTIESFGATIDGGGYTVSDLTVPFIRNMNDGARIINVHFDINITGTVGLDDNVGGVVVTNHGYFENVWVSGEINLSGQRYVGGLIGSNYGCLRNIENTATVTCADYAGGIVGYNDGTVAFCVNNGNVVSLAGSHVGGDEPTPVRHSGGIVGYVVSGVQLNGCVTTVDNGRKNPLFGDTSSSADFSLSVVVTTDMLDRVLSEWLNYNPNNGELCDDDDMPVNADKTIWYDNTSKWVRYGAKPRLALFNK